MAELLEEQNESVPTFQWGKYGAVIVGVLGVSMWLQLGLPGLMVEFRFPEPRPWMLLLYVIPLIALYAAVVTRHAALALLVFPISLLPAIAGLPEADQALVHGGLAMARIGGTVAVYLAVASAWIASIDTRDESAPVGTEHQNGRHYRRYVFSRLVAMLLVLLVPLYAVLFDPVIVSTIEQNHPNSEGVAQNFLSLLVFFFWAVVAYTHFLVPALNLEYDRRKTRAKIRELRRGEDPRGRVLRLAIEGGIVLSFVIVIFLAS